jgi:hypothetical protein
MTKMGRVTFWAIFHKLIWSPWMEQSAEAFCSKKTSCPKMDKDGYNVYPQKGLIGFCGNFF